MKILSLDYYNTEQEWGYKKIDFFDLTLLVGVSGVGKTQILRSIYFLKHIADGSSENGVKWDTVFETISGKVYNWKGEFENIKSKSESIIDFIDSDNDKIKPKIIYEELSLDGEIIIKRNLDSFLFNNKEMPKLNSNESAINILKEEDLIKEIFDSFKLIVFRDHTQKEGVRFSGFSIEKLKKKFDTFKKIKESDLDTFNKLALTYDVSKDTFEEIKTRFIEVFPQIEDVKLEPVRDDEFCNSNQRNWC